MEWEWGPCIVMVAFATIQAHLSIHPFIKLTEWLTGWQANVTSFARYWLLDQQSSVRVVKSYQSAFKMKLNGWLFALSLPFGEELYCFVLKSWQEAFAPNRTWNANRVQICQFAWLIFSREKKERVISDLFKLVQLSFCSFFFIVGKMAA